jgi:hypothetical protein
LSTVFLPDPEAYSQEDIIGLYTPERLLTLNLEKWMHEDENDVPCYYFAYNTAYAYSLLKKGKIALAWLEVALRMNRSFSKLILKDKDLEYVRDEYANEVRKLVE